MRFVVFSSFREGVLALALGLTMPLAAGGQTTTNAVPDSVAALAQLQPSSSEPDNGLESANRVKMLLKQQEIDQASAAAQDELQKHPEIPLAWYSAGDVLMHQKRWHDAIPDLQKSVALNPKIGPAWMELGICLMQDGQPDEAIDAMTHAVDQMPDLLEAWEYLGHFFAAKHDYLGAEEKFEDLLKTHPRSAVGWLLLGGIQSYEQLPASAITSLQKSVALNPALPEAWNNLGLAYARDKQLDKALDAFEQAAHARPNYDEALNNIGFTYLTMGRTDRAIESFNAALKANPKHKRALFNIVVAYAKLGKLDLAHQNYQTLAAIDPAMAANLAVQAPGAATSPSPATATPSPPTDTNAVAAAPSNPPAPSNADATTNASPVVLSTTTNTPPVNPTPASPAAPVSIPVTSAVLSPSPAPLVAVTNAPPVAATNLPPVVQTAASPPAPAAMQAAVPPPAPITSTRTPAAPPVPVAPATNAPPSPVAVAVTAQADAAVGYTVMPPDPWVKPLDPDTVAIPASEEVAGGIDYILIDNQQRLDPPAFFSHSTLRVTAGEGLENASDLRAEFDPNYQSLVIHQLRVKRDGAWQNRLGSDTFQVLHREQNLDSQMLDGRYSVVCHLQDIRVGDVVDFSYTIKGTNPAFGGKYVDSFLTTYPRPVHLFSNQLTTTPNRLVNLKSFGGAVEPTRTTNDDLSELITWKKKEVPAAQAEANTPGWYNVFGWVEVSEFSSWKEVVDWGLSIFSLNDAPSSDLAAKIAEIARAHRSPEDRALAVLNFVQNDVRYLGVEMGANSYKPNPATSVFAHRFGDCKDKTQLAVIMLRALGLEAYPALVSTTRGTTVDDLLPSPLVFDHAIVQLTVDARTYWIDVTRSNQHGHLRDFFVDDFKRALLLKPDNDALTTMSTSPESLPRVEMTDVFTVTPKSDSVGLAIHSVFRGHSAETLRSLFQFSTPDEIERNYLAYYAKEYSKITSSKPLRFQDFPDDNHFDVWEEYTIPGFWTRQTPQSRWQATFVPLSITGAVGGTMASQRIAPYQLEYPQEISEKLEIHLFRPWPLESTPFDLTTPSFAFSFHPSTSGKTLTYDYHYKTLAADLPIAGIGDYNDQITQVRKKLEHMLSYLPDGSLDTGRGDFRLNWTAVLLEVPTLVVLLAGAVWINCLRGSRRHRDAAFGYGEYEGLNGWLILVIIGMISNLIVDGATLCGLSNQVFNLTEWNEYTTPAGTHYDPHHAPTLLFETLSFTVLFVTTLLAFVLMFRKKYTYPFVMIGFYVGAGIIHIIDYLLASQITSLHENPARFASTIYRFVMTCVIWVPYFLTSKRVKATFRY